MRRTEADGTGEAPARPGRAILPLVLFVVGAGLMLPFEATATRVAGVIALFAFVVSGVFAIADPRWLAGAPELGRPPAADAPKREGDE